MIKSVVFFFGSRRKELGKIIRLKRQPFEPSLVFAVFPVLICVAVLISKNGPDVRYLLPLHGVVAVFGALYLDHLRQAQKKQFTFLLVLWLGFGFVNTCYFYTHTSKTYYLYHPTSDTYRAKGKGLVQNLSIVRMSSPYDGIIKFCQEKGISFAYSNYDNSRNDYVFDAAKCHKWVITQIMMAQRVLVACWPKKRISQLLFRHHKKMNFPLIKNFSKKKTLNTCEKKRRVVFGFFDILREKQQKLIHCVLSGPSDLFKINAL